MNKELAIKLLPYVNDPSVKEAWQAYADYRIEVLKNLLTGARTHEEVLKLQGGIQELKRFETLLAEVLQQRDR